MSDQYPEPGLFILACGALAWALVLLMLVLNARRIERTVKHDELDALLADLDKPNHSVEREE